MRLRGGALPGKREGYERGACASVPSEQPQVRAKAARARRREEQQERVAQEVAQEVTQEEGQPTLPIVRFGSARSAWQGVGRRASTLGRVSPLSAARTGAGMCLSALTSPRESGTVDAHRRTVVRPIRTERARERGEPRNRCLTDAPSGSSSEMRNSSSRTVVRRTASSAVARSCATCHERSQSALIQLLVSAGTPERRSGSTTAMLDVLMI